jgi:phytoene dehydrogenase-like protein
MASKRDAVIVGAGLAGLTCALRLEEAGLDVQLVDAADRCGGRVRTDRVDGFLLDRGFQVLLDSYPEPRRWLDMDALDLRCFSPGALVRIDGKTTRVADPFRSPTAIPATTLSRIGTMADKIRMLRLRYAVRDGATFDGRTTQEALEAFGFSHLAIERFFLPFFGGVFLDRNLDTDSARFAFLFDMFARGSAAVPAEGMEVIPQQLVHRLRNAPLLGTTVREINEGGVKLATGLSIDARVTIVATDARTAYELIRQEGAPAWRPSTTVYFDAPEPPRRGPWLMLNGDGVGVVNHVAVMSEVSPSYAPNGRALVAVSVLGKVPVTDAELVAAVRVDLTDWFSRAVSSWRLLRVVRVPMSLPVTPEFIRRPAPLRPRPDLFVCGDHVGNPSIEGAMVSGRTAAEGVIAHLHTR